MSKTRREIWHYSTLMATLEGKTFTQVSRGWGSVSDGKGLSKLRTGVRSKNYKEAQGKFSKKVVKSPRRCYTIIMSNKLKTKKQSGWNDADRRAFADGQRLRAVTIQNKPKPKPEAREWV